MGKHRNTVPHTNIRVQTGAHAPTAGKRPAPKANGATVVTVTTGSVVVTVDVGSTPTRRRARHRARRPVRPLIPLVPLVPLVPAIKLGTTNIWKAQKKPDRFQLVQVPASSADCHSIADFGLGVKDQDGIQDFVDAGHRDFQRRKDQLTNIAFQLLTCKNPRAVHTGITRSILLVSLRTAQMSEFEQKGEEDLGHLDYTFNLALQSEYALNTFNADAQNLPDRTSAVDTPCRLGDVTPLIRTFACSNHLTIPGVKVVELLKKKYDNNVDMVRDILRGRADFAELNHII
jgi:hypothetical protein